ncbi:MAG TPA: hopanoid-associated sugar epimerase [Acidimicrobiales bacterium]
MTASGARPYGEGDLVVVTGAAGFIGSHIVQAALGRGCRVRALVEPGVATVNLADVDAELVAVDVRDKAGVADAVDGAQLVVHAAALYRFWAPDPERFYDINVGGTTNVIEAAAASGTRVVYTSTVGTIGLRTDGQLATEDDHPHIEHLYGFYKRSKYAAEHEALRLAAQGADVVLALPTFPVGPADRSPTPTGQTILRFLNGRMPAYVETTLNVAHVADVAEGHLLAAERGRTGRSYILGGENLTLHELLDALAAHTGLPSPKHRAPSWTALAAGRVSTAVQGRLLHREPTVPLEAARMSTSRMSFDDSRARTELGYTSRPAAEALADAADWFQANGYA